MLENFTLRLEQNYSIADQKRMEAWGGIPSTDLKKIEITKALLDLPGDEHTPFEWNKVGNFFRAVSGFDFAPFADSDDLPVDGGSDHTPNSWTVSPEMFNNAAEVIARRIEGKGVNEKSKRELSRASFASRRLVESLDVDKEVKKNIRRVFIKVIREV